MVSDLLGVALAGLQTELSLATRQFIEPIATLIAKQLLTELDAKPLPEPLAGPLAKPFAQPLAGPFTEPLAQPFATSSLGPLAQPLIMTLAIATIHQPQSWR